MDQQLAAGVGCSKECSCSRCRLQQGLQELQMMMQLQQGDDGSAGSGSDAEE